MLNMKHEMNQIIRFFLIKHRGHWDKAYNSIRSKEPVTFEEISQMNKNPNDNCISIIDTDYPNNFKEIYMPPLCIFMQGHKELVNADDAIHSLWGLSDFNKFQDYNLDKNQCYAVFYDDNQVEAINRIVSDGYKLILVDQHNTSKKNLDKLDYTKQIVFVTEIPSEVKNAEVSPHQCDERMLLGLSKHAIGLDMSDTEIEKLIPLLEFENRKFTIYGDGQKSKFKTHHLFTFKSNDSINESVARHKKLNQTLEMAAEKMGFTSAK